MPTQPMKPYAGPKSPVKHRYTRRAAFHDYREPCIYMFTLRKRESAPLFSTVSGNPRMKTGPEAPAVRHTPCGGIVQQEIDKLESYRPDKIKLIKTVIMPDHVHFMLRVRQTLEKPVTSFIAATMSAITSRLRQAGSIAPVVSCFEKGITDSIVRGKGRYQVIYDYICDNPRRLLMKKLYPDLFRRRLAISIKGDVYDAVGNIFLLRRPLVAVHVRRAWSQEDTEGYQEKCRAMAANGSVLISPFIHPAEKAIRDAVIEDGGSVIVLVSTAFRERWKPSGRAFDLCAAGRMLYLAETGSPEVEPEMRYALASHMNRLAETIAGTGLARMEVKGDSLSSRVSRRLPPPDLPAPPPREES